jgi:polyisoprenoid-binding protein YceI
VDTQILSSIHPIHGTATDLRGLIEGHFDSEGRPDFELPCRGWVEIPVQAIKSGSRLNDLEMQRRAEMHRFPSIRFEVDRVWAPNGGDRYRVTLKVTAHGQTQSVHETFRLRLDGRRLVAEGYHTFDMRDFGVTPPGILTFRVMPEVKVSVRLVADEEGMGER